MKQKVDRSSVAAIADCPSSKRQGEGSGRDFVFDFVLTGHLIGWPVYGRLGPHTVLPSRMLDNTSPYLPPPPPAWRTQMKSCLSWPPNVWLVMKCALIWSPVECISRRQQAEGGGQRAAGSWNLQIGIGNRQLASSAIWYHKSSIAACMTGRKGAFCAASHSNDMPKAKVACCTLPQAGYTYMCTVHPVCIVLETCMNAFTLLHRWILYMNWMY